MHELSLAQNIMEIIKKEMPRYNLTKIDTVTLRIGEMAQVMPDALIFGFECLTQGTIHDGARIFEISCKTGQGLSKWHDWLKTLVNRK